MGAAADLQAHRVARSTTPKTDAAKFTITAADVGTLAVRHGLAADLEEERQALLLAAKIAARRLGPCGDSIAAHALEAAIRMAEAGR